MESDILVDSNVFIALIKAKGDPGPPLATWAGNSNLVICGMVRLEVLRGIRSPKALSRLSAFMDVMVNIPSDVRLWNEATQLAWEMDRKGFVISGPDAVIASSALRIGAAVLTSDAHFSRIEGLRVIAPPQEWFEK